MTDTINGNPTFGVPPTSGAVFRALSLLTPFDIDRPKVRIGNPRDGGYVLADGFAGRDVLSFGIAGDVGFERDMADRGHRCFLYDHTIESPPEQHPGFAFSRLGLGGEKSTDPYLLSLATHVAAQPDLSDRLILKLDIEGAEWDVFSTTSPDVLGRFDQIVGEFHWLQRLVDQAYRDAFVASLQAITADFTLFHVHANNCRVLDIVGGFAVADVLELSFVRTSLIYRQPSRTVYPASENMGNNHVVPDHALLFYPFLPTSVADGQILDVIRRIECEAEAG